MNALNNGKVSYWYADMGGIPAPRPPLPGQTDADVAIVGAGYTGLWAAYYLQQLRPELRIIIIEREFAGFGGSGRNGGQLLGGFGWDREKYLQTSCREDVMAMERAMADCVDEVIHVAAKEGIEADIKRVDKLLVATNAAQLKRLREEMDLMLRWGVAESKLDFVQAAEARARINVCNVLGGLVIRGVARVQPAKLVRGLAAAVERLGVNIYEDTVVTGIEKGRVRTNRGDVRARTIVRATEGFTAGFKEERRTWLALNSAQIVTEPLPERVWAEIGWQGHELLGDEAHTYCYAQRTRDGRIAMGGRGVPYRYGSRTDVCGQTQQSTIDKLHDVLIRLFPRTAGCRIHHAWCGVLGVPRDWCATVGLDIKTGIGWAGGYVGDGISTSNLAGRTLADLILERKSDLTRLPWVNRRVRRWEPEPLRWLGVHAMYQLYRMADQRESNGLSQTSLFAKIANRITGH